jgi:alkylation response protein AidB-like acyl-CoA dehydrogenase
MQYKNDQTVLRQMYAFTDIGCAAVALGLTEAAFNAALKYSKERRQFNRPICEFPMVREMLVNMKTKIEAARLLVFNAAALCDNGQDYISAAHIARLFCCDAAVYAGTKSVQVHGGYGYSRDYPVERYLRDAKTLQVLLGAPYEIKSEVARELFL